MIGHYLSNNNENATVTFRQKFQYPNGAWVCHENLPTQTYTRCSSSGDIYTLVVQQNDKIIKSRIITKNTRKSKKENN